VADVAAARKELQAQGVNASVEPVYVRATGRTVLNLRDPDGWRLQLVDAARRVARPDLGAVTSTVRAQRSGTSFRIMPRRSNGLYGLAR
jgi:hypothetical protein